MTKRALYRAHLLGWILVAAVSVPLHSQTRIGNSGSPLLGRWTLVAYEDRKDEKDTTSEWIYRYGKKTSGYIAYDNTGHMSVQIMRTPAAGKFASKEEDDAPTPEEAKQVFEGYVAYYGTYSFEESGHVVIHHVEGSLHPNYIGTDQRRPFRLSGDTLIIGDQTTWRRVFVRVK